MKSQGEEIAETERSELRVGANDAPALLSPLSARLAAEIVAFLVQQDELFVEAPSARRDLPAK